MVTIPAFEISVFNIAANSTLVTVVSSVSPCDSSTIIKVTVAVVASLYSTMIYSSGWPVAAALARLKASFISANSSAVMRLYIPPNLWGVPID